MLCQPQRHKTTRDCPRVTLRLSPDDHERLKELAGSMALSTYSVADLYYVTYSLWDVRLLDDAFVDLGADTQVTTNPWDQ